MASTRDHVAAYDYESRRRVTSLVLGADEAGKDPRRRLNRTLVGSTVIAVLVMAGFGVAGLLGGGRGPDVPDSGAVVVKGRGDRYVVIEGVVHPALNLASALLVGGGTLTEVRADALDKHPRGVPVGIPDVPDALPAPDRLTGGPWTVCVRPSDSDVVPPTVAVMVGLPAPANGVFATGTGVLAAEPGAASSADTWLLTAGRRYRLTDGIRRVLGLQRARVLPVPTEILDTVPEGPQIAIPTVQRGGAPSVRLPVQAAVGDLVRTTIGGAQTEYFLVQADGLSPISELTYRLLSAGAKTVEADAASITGVPTSRATAPGQRGWPDQVPDLVEPERDQPLCVSTVPGQPGGDAPWAATISVPPSLPQPAGVKRVASQNDDLPGVTTQVLAAPGRGALVLATSSSGQDGTFTLVTDAGQRFPISSAEAVSRLRYDPGAAVRIPLPFVALLPAGPVLDPDAAAREVPGVPDRGPFAAPTP